MKLPRFLANIVRQGADLAVVTRRNFDDLASVLAQYATFIEDALERLTTLTTRLNKLPSPAILGKGAIWDVKVFGTIANAVTYLGSSTATLYITNAQTVSANLTIPSNISIVVLKGGSFDIATGVTLTINRLQADDYHIVKTGLGALAITALTYRRSPIWYGATGDGSTFDTTSLQMAADDLRPGCKLIHPAPSGGFYRTDAVIEYADLQGCIVDFVAAPDNALPAFPNYAIKYDGSGLTGYENPVVRVVGCTRTSFYGLSVHGNGKAEYGLWFSGLNSYTGSAPSTPNLYRSIGCRFYSYASTGCTVCGAQVGEETATSSQTDLFTFYEPYFAVSESATQIALDTQPATFGLKGVGANTYGVFLHPQLTGDYGAYFNAGSFYLERPYFLGDAGLYVNAKTCDVTMIQPYSEGLLGRPVWLDSGDGTDAKNINIIGAKFFPGSKATATINTATDVAALSKTFDGATDINTTTDRINIVAHGFVTGDPIYVDLGAGTFPVASPVITTGSRLWAIRIDADNFQLSATQGGSAIDFTSAGSGTITLRSGAITETGHTYVTGDKLIYSDGGGTTIPGLTDDGAHYAIRLDANRFTLASSLANSQSGTFLDISGTGVGSSHTFTWRPAPMRFQSNMNVTLIGCFAEDWITDNAGSTGQKPVYTDIGNIWLHPTDYSANPDIRLFRFSTFAGAGATEWLRYTHNVLRQVVTETAGPASGNAGWSGVDIRCVNSASGNTWTPPAAYKGSSFRIWKEGSGVLIVTDAASGGSLRRHDTGGTATTDVRAFSPLEMGYIQLDCVVDGEYQVSSPMALSYDSEYKVETTDATVTTLHTFTVPSSVTYFIEATVIARRTGGSAGTAEDGASYKMYATYKNVAGTATIIGAASIAANEDQAGWDCAFSPTSDTVRIRVTGAVDNNISWSLADVKTLAVST